MKQNGIKFGRNQNIEFKKCLELYRKIFVKALNESWHKFCSFCISESEQNEAKGLILGSNRPYPLPNIQTEEIFNKKFAKS